MTVKWDVYFMGLAKAIAVKSKDPSTRVGCLIVGQGMELVCSGYNGIPRGVLDLPERLARPAKYYWVSHAEANCVAHAARIGVPLNGCKAYTTHTPCSGCAKALIQAGIKEVIVGLGTTSMPEEEFDVAKQMFTEAGVKVRKYEEL